MAAHVFKDPFEFRLKTSDMYEFPDRLLDDEDATVEKEGITDGTLLWLEQGKVTFSPSHKKMTMNFSLQSKDR